MLAQVTMSRALVRFSLEATSITDRGSLPEHRNVRLPGVSRLEWTQLKVIIVLLTSKKWRLQSGCNHSTAYVDQ